MARGLSRHAALTSLNMSANRIGPEGGQALATALHQNRGMISLDLFGNELEDDGAIAFCQALSGCQSLAFLNLWCNFIGPRTAGEISALLLNGVALRELQLGSNQIGSVGIQALVPGLAGCSTLTSIDLGDNSIDDHGASLLADCLRSNQVLTSLVLRNNHIRVDGCLALADALRPHPRLRVLNLGGNDVTRADCDNVQAAFKGNTVLTQLVIFPRVVGVSAATPIQKLNVDEPPKPIVVPFRTPFMSSVPVTPSPKTVAPSSPVARPGTLNRIPLRNLPAPTPDSRYAQLLAEQARWDYTQKQASGAVAANSQLQRSTTRKATTPKQYSARPALPSPSAVTPNWSTSSGAFDMEAHNRYAWYTQQFSATAPVSGSPSSRSAGLDASPVSASQPLTYQQPAMTLSATSVQPPRAAEEFTQSALPFTSTYALGSLASTATYDSGRYAAQYQPLSASAPAFAGALGVTSSGVLPTPTPLSQPSLMNLSAGPKSVSTGTQASLPEDLAQLISSAVAVAAQHSPTALSYNHLTAHLGAAVHSTAEAVTLPLPAFAQAPSQPFHISEATPRSQFSERSGATAQSLPIASPRSLASSSPRSDLTGSSAAIVARRAYGVHSQQPTPTLQFASVTEAIGIAMPPLLAEVDSPRTAFVPSPVQISTAPPPEQDDSAVHYPAHEPGLVPVAMPDTYHIDHPASALPSQPAEEQVRSATASSIASTVSAPISALYNPDVLDATNEAIAFAKTALQMQREYEERLSALKAAREQHFRELERLKAVREASQSADAASLSFGSSAAAQAITPVAIPAFREQPPAPREEHVVDHTPYVVPPMPSFDAPVNVAPIVQPVQRRPEPTATATATAVHQSVEQTVVQQHHQHSLPVQQSIAQIAPQEPIHHASEHAQLSQPAAGKYQDVQQQQPPVVLPQPVISQQPPAQPAYVSVEPIVFDTAPLATSSPASAKPAPILVTPIIPAQELMSSGTPLSQPGLEPLSPRQERSPSVPASTAPPIVQPTSAAAADPATATTIATSAVIPDVTVVQPSPVQVEAKEPTSGSPVTTVNPLQTEMRRRSSTSLSGRALSPLADSSAPTATTVVPSAADTIVSTATSATVPSVPTTTTTTSVPVQQAPITLATPSSEEPPSLVQPGILHPPALNEVEPREAVVPVNIEEPPGVAKPLQEPAKQEPAARKEPVVDYAEQQREATLAAERAARALREKTLQDQRQREEEAARKQRDAEDAARRQREADEAARKQLEAEESNRTRSNTGGSGGSHSPASTPAQPLTVVEAVEVPTDRKVLYQAMYSNQQRRNSLNLSGRSRGSMDSKSSFSASAASAATKALAKGSAEFPGRTILPGRKKKEDVVLALNRSQFTVSLKKLFGKNQVVKAYKIIPGVYTEVDTGHPRGFLYHTPESNEPVFFTSKQRDAFMATLAAFVERAAEEAAAAADVPDFAPGDEMFPPPPDGAPPDMRRIRVVHDYATDDPRMLSLYSGEILHVSGEEGGWLIAVNDQGQEGYVPPDYVEDF
eukprot:TRINITY_DN13328_c0_g1_i1.p1 TRINITY_DN13328_c0_g1~~TRINITY_DN13328_c0_g1_i1.p1  ORF type:complete len:1633 (-),score=384.88 TRINITY_DN13328_c0_g1_i1:46-4599(-)